jgi:hypothetical protein
MIGCGAKKVAGGTLLAVRPHLHPKRLEHLEGSAEVVWCSVKAGQLNFLVCSAYRRPTYDKNYPDYDKHLLASLELAAA